ncbi:MAG TPA: multicopper oxidase family protein [Vicinamibacterales bacterium]|nr:multicopper oxidase family protein [Vicinamibacterales bacterium]
MHRRQFLVAAGAWTCAAAADLRLSAQSEPADITLRIAETAIEVGPQRTIRTRAYNGQVPGPLLRARRGQRLVVDVINETNSRDIVHWHGLHIPPAVDGAYDEGTPPVPPHGRERYAFTVEPGGTRWYHSHDTAMRDLAKGPYTGQFGMLVVEADGDPGAYDVEVPLLLHEWEPRFSRSGPLDVEFRTGSINGRMLGFGEPVRVRAGQRALLRILNASATLAHRVSFTGHVFRVVAMDGNPVPRPTVVRTIEVAPGERVDAVVEMNNPGIWVLGDTDDERRAAGLGIVVEYAGQSGAPRWSPPGPYPFDYAVFASPEPAPEPDDRLTLVFKAKEDGHHWTINGQSWPKIDPIVVHEGRRSRWTLDNQSANDHPIHLHRHTFAVVSVAGRRMSGLMKDVVVVPAWRQVEIDVRADQPGLSLFHCHQQFHMDMGFMAMVRYA